ncbi:alpha/beta hydrolase [Trebonia sp.]|uniref:alpha/beta fold hydrolase n=1 Tax=Trebonia sp. TaxID=2767075 RepID=UPI00262F992C|nr:alpha/beta hydrolase [Trebonia sp.]
MVAVSQGFTALGDEFALVAQTAAEAGIAGGPLPRVRRGWVNVPTGGHVSGVFWGEGQPELVFLHDIGESARAWDAVALAAGRPSVAIDLPGHGRSDWRRDGRYEPGKLAPAVAEAIRSFAPRARLVAGGGLGGRTGLALHRRYPAVLAGLALVNTLPGSPGGPGSAWTGPERFASPEEALAALAARRPEHSGQALHREVLYELVQNTDGAWVWRHHPGNLRAAPDPGQEAGGDDGLWTELGQLAIPVALIRGDWAGPLTADDLARLRQRAPRVRVITLQTAGADIPATQPAALAAALDQLLTTEPARQQ